MRVALIGFGAIGQVVAAHLLKDPHGPQLCAVVVRNKHACSARAVLPAGVGVFHDIADILALKPDLVVECAGQAAVRQYAADVLSAGVDLMIISTGALAAPGYNDALAKAVRGTAQIIIPAGAIAGLDGLGALKIAGLSAVSYTSVKPPLAWKGTPAEKFIALETLTQQTAFFEGSAREAAMLYPKNANLAATVALAGIGFDKTRVCLVADPDARGNTGRIDAQSVIGDMTLVMDGAASANPKTSASTAFSLIHAIRNRGARLFI